MDLKDELISIFPSCDTLKIESGVRKYGQCYDITIGAMYEPPVLNFGILKSLSEMFGTDEINVDDYSQAGCETCDYGSEYGHTIEIRRPTLRLAELAALSGTSLVDKR